MNNMHRTTYACLILIVECAFTIAVGFTGADDDVNKSACNSNRPGVLSSAGSLHSPPDPDGQNGYPHNVHCSWLLIAPEHHVVRIEFTEFDLETGDQICSFGNVTLYDGYSENANHNKIDRYCGDTLPPVVHSAGNDLLVSFKTGHLGIGTGIRANFDFFPVQEVACSQHGPYELNYSIGGIVSPGYPHYDYGVLRRQGSNCSWKITPDADIRMEFDALVLDSDCAYANISIYDGAELLDIFCENREINPIGITQPSMLVKFQSSNAHSGFRARFMSYNITERSCGNNDLAELDWAPGYITSPNSDDSLCRWRFHIPQGKVVKLEIEYFDLPNCTNCGCSSLTFYDGDNEFAPLLGTYCTNGWSAKYIISGGNSAYLVYKNYKLAPHRGFKIKYSFYDIAEHACGSSKPITLTEKQGMITSPGYGSQTGYPPYSDCQWQITAKETEIIRIEYLEFGLEDCSGCSCDRLLVYNGLDSSATLMDQHCGFLLPPSRKTTVNSTFLRFISDDHYGTKGFKINYYVEVLADTACGFEIPYVMSLQPGYVYSPNYGGYYPMDSHCEWLITAPDDKVVELSFQMMDIEYGHYCEFDYLAIYNGLSSSSPSLRRICGKDQPANVSSTQYAMLLVFISNGNLQFEGFKATYHFIEKPKDSIALVPVIICGVLCGLGLIVVLAVCFKVRKRISNYFHKRRHRNEQPDLDLPPPYDDGVHAVPSNCDVACPPAFGRDQYHEIAAYPPPTYEESFLDDHLQPHGLLRPPSYEDMQPARDPSPPPPPFTPEPQLTNSLAGVAVLAPQGMPGYNPPPEQPSIPVPSATPVRRTTYLHNPGQGGGRRNPAFVSSTEEVPLEELKQEEAQAVAAILQGHRNPQKTDEMHKEKANGPDGKKQDLGKFSRSDNNLVGLSGGNWKIPDDGQNKEKRLSGQFRGRASSLSSLEFVDGRSALRLPSDISDTAV